MFVVKVGKSVLKQSKEKVIDCTLITSKNLVDVYKVNMCKAMQCWVEETIIFRFQVFV